MATVDVACTNCRRPYPLEGTPYRCPACGGLYDFTSPPAYHAQQVDPDQPGIWRFRHALGLPEQSAVVTLGEGDTPLIWAQAQGRQAAFKLEYLNPSGSFKDRGSAPLMSFLLSRGISAAIEDSSGNAGASFAAYAARAGIQARVFIPDSASGPKRRQIESYGADVVRILGPRSKAAEAVRREADNGSVYASHAYLPFNLAGYATLAYELVEQLDQEPGTVILPAGQGGLLLGIARGFQALLQARRISRLPRLVGVQARVCAPLWAVSQYGGEGLAWVSEGQTVAEGIRVRHPLRGDAVLSAVAASQGMILAVDETDILPGRDELARRGFYVEPTSAVVWSALAQLEPDFPDPLIVILTGSGFKYKDVI